MMNSATNHCVSMPQRPRRRDGLACHRLDNEAVVYDLAHHTLHYLNATARFIWEQCDGARPVEAIIEQVRTNFDTQSADRREAESIELQVQATLLELAGNGLIDEAADR